MQAWTEKKKKGGFDRTPPPLSAPCTIQKARYLHVFSHRIGQNRHGIQIVRFVALEEGSEQHPLCESVCAVLFLRFNQHVEVAEIQLQVFVGPFLYRRRLCNPSSKHQWQSTTDVSFPKFCRLEDFVVLNDRSFRNPLAAEGFQMAAQIRRIFMRGRRREGDVWGGRIA